jgi:Lon-like protease
MREDLQLPEPPGVKPVRGLPIWRWVITAIIIVALMAIAIFVPIPIIYVYLPGPVSDAEDLVEVTGEQTYSSEGSLYMTTVSVDTAVTFIELVIAGVDSSRAVVMRDDVTQGQTLKELQRQQNAQMDQSQVDARQVALTSLGYGQPEGRGARVITTITGSPADGVLLPDDVIVAVDGLQISTTCDVGQAIVDEDTGDVVKVTVLREDERRSFDLELAENPIDGSPTFIGVQMRTLGFSFEPGVDVDFKTGEIAGPSAGLILSLALYDRLTPDDLTAGHRIAGTGTLDCDGGVGPIGGIQQKVAGAQAKGAEFFLTPMSNVEEARSVADDIEIVPVATFAEALEYLGGLE